MSAVEAAANVAVGYGVACLTNAFVLPAFGFHISLGQNLSIGAIFTVVSLVRSYLLRRVFNRFHQKPKGKML
jgi:membrane protein implicated in regulation of membrane protease activity